MATLLDLLFAVATWFALYRLDPTGTVARSLGLRPRTRR
jgi:hypothetical protein